MNDAPNTAPNAAQAEYWNQTAGPIWTSLQDALDQVVRPLGDAAMAALAPKPGEAILDLGCGGGQTTLQLAQAVCAGGRVVGADISGTMLAAARARAVPAGAATPEFRDVDVQTGDLGQSAFDGAFSRFGVMFYADPAAAFANIRRALKSGGRLAFVCWRALAENLWMRTPLEAAAALLPPMPRPGPEDPGPFAFADPERVRTVLGAAGFGDIQLAPFDAAIGAGSDLESAVSLVMRVGPLGAALRENPGLARAVTDAVRGALAPHLTTAGVRLPGAVWIVTARA